MDEKKVAKKPGSAPPGDLAGDAAGGAGSPSAPGRTGRKWAAPKVRRILVAGLTHDDPGLGADGGGPGTNAS